MFMPLEARLTDSHIDRCAQWGRRSCFVDSHNEVAGENEKCVPTFNVWKVVTIHGGQVSVFRRGHVADDVLAICPCTTKVSMLPRNVTLVSPAADLLHQLAARRCGNFASPLSLDPGTQAPFEMLCFRNHEERAARH